MNTFSNGKFSINVKTVADAVRELSLLNQDIPMNQDYDGNGSDLVVMNRKEGSIHIHISEGGFWDEDVEIDQE